MAGEVRVRVDPGAVSRYMAGPEVERELARRAVKVEGAAKRLCPVDTGRLRASITHSIDRDGRGPLAYIGTNVEYAIFVELGTRFMRAQPFLRPALRAAA